jgi:acyl-CoA reductase-like NAD-dependent aldehyde dehydrogenase
MKEISREELFGPGCGVWVVTVEEDAWKVIGAGTAINLSAGPYTEEKAREVANRHEMGVPGERRWIPVPFKHRFTYYERFGKRVE